MEESFHHILSLSLSLPFISAPFSLSLSLSLFVFLAGAAHPKNEEEEGATGSFNWVLLGGKNAHWYLANISPSPPRSAPFTKRSITSIL